MKFDCSLAADHEAVNVDRPSQSEAAALATATEAAPPDRVLAVAVRHDDARLAARSGPKP
jgi:hypothetical protein